MFYISKILWGFLQPSALIGLLLVAGPILAAFGRKRAGIRLLAAGAFLYTLFGFFPLGNWLLIALETRAGIAAESSLAGASGIIVLGGAVGQPPPSGTSVTHLNDAADRMVAALVLAAKYPAMPVIFTGGRVYLFEGAEGDAEAVLATKFFEQFGIKPPRLQLESMSRNTHENAVLTANLLRPTPGQNWILVTSAYHMQRAKGLFQAQGFRILPWPVDFKTKGTRDMWRFFPEPAEGLRRTDYSIKEWVGFLVSWLRGEIR
ncbi:MAG: YdcF family protein [Rhodomicrobium sp.]